MTDWEPNRYLTYADERSRPFFDLLSRVRASEPRRVVDLGCGPGQLTVGLVERWPNAQILGLDSSPAMIDSARTRTHPHVSFAVADLRDWQPDEPVDVLVSNATLQWVPEHRDLMPRFVSALATSGWLAFGVPGNFSAPSHTLLYDLARDERFRRHTDDLAWPASADASDYLADLARLGCAVEAWETTYLHVLTGADPVFDWISSTGARPVLQSLPPDLRGTFEAEYKAELRRAYPSHPYGTVLPFRRIFVVAQRNS
jgi:trans-aconitate 2-methyltransferase